MELKNSLLIVQKKIIEDYTDIQMGTNSNPSYMVIRNKPIESQLDSFITYGLDGDPQASKPFKQAKDDFLNNSIYGYIAGHNVDGDYILKVVEDKMEDKTIFNIQEQDITIEVDVEKGTEYLTLKAHSMSLK